MILLAPIWLWLALPLALALYRWPLPTRGLNFLRGITLVLLLLAMAQPAMKLPDRHGYVVVVADRSESMPPDSADRQLQAIATLHDSMGRSDRLAVVSFGDRVVNELSAGLEGMDSFQAPGGQQHSRLTDGIEEALSQIPPDDTGQLLILSDGHWTGRDPGAVIARAAGRGVKVDHFWDSRPRGTDLAIKDLQVPATVAPGQSFMLSGWIASPSAQTIDYRLTKHGQPVSSGQRQVPTGLSRILFRDRAKISGVAAYELTVTPPGGLNTNGTSTGTAAGAGDAFPENNRARALVEVRGTKPVLLVSEFGAESGLAKLMVQGGLKLVARKPSQCPWTLADLSRWSAVVLENVMAGDIGLDGMRTLNAWVEDSGAGLVMTGGEKSYAPGGYYKSLLEELLPVSMERRNEVRKLQTAIVVTLDRSGSMGMSVPGGKTKMQLANIGTAQVLDLLAPTDEFGVIAVDTDPHIILRLATADLQKNATFRNKILSMQSMGGGIFIENALKAAAAMLRRAKSGNKHLILFADAQDSEQPGAYRTLIASMRKVGITISVVGLGTDKDVDAPLLKDIAKRGGGNIYFTDRPKEIPRIFAQDTFAVARKTFITEATPVQVTGALSPLGFARTLSPPALGGYNLTYAKPNASIGLITRDEHKAPVVAYWQAGNGRVACFTGEADGQYAGRFANWTGAGDFYATLTRWAAGSQSPLPDNMLLTQEVREGVCFIQLHLDPQRTGESFTKPPHLTILRNQPGQDTRKETLSLQWKTADLLETTLPIDGAETLLATLNLTTNLSQTLPPVCLHYSPEFAPDRPDRGRQFLAQLSAATGGQERPANLDAIWESLPRTPRYVQLSIWLIIAALILFLLEVLQRRTGLLAFGKKSIRTDETALATTNLKKREPLAQADEKKDAPAEKEKIFTAPKRKRKHRQAALPDAPPITAPPILGGDAAEVPPVIENPPSTFDALGAAQKRAKDREGGK